VQLPGRPGSHPVHLPKDASSGGPGGFFSFDPDVIGAGLELPRSQGAVNIVVRQRASSEEKSSLHGLVVAGKGHLLPYMLGAFFAIKVLKMDLDCTSQTGAKAGISRGGTRIGITTRQMEGPPATLLSKPRDSWVLGRGFVRGQSGQTSCCVPANLEKELSEGDELGFLVTKDTGAILLFRRSDRYDEWTCMVHWDANVPDYKNCIALLELSGAILEVELLHGRQPPPVIDRPVDEVQLPKRVWP